ncbi:MAG TPA: sensor histidine kinase, partial [Blastocatellia bacterium]|nr:sensor histidine kinase [Blastocatellia bacterium]
LRSAITQLQAEIKTREAAESERQRLLERIVQAQEEERRRISRELHDHVGQQLTALRLGLESLRQAKSQDTDTEGLKNIIRQLDEEVDFLAWELRPAALDEHGLEAALSNFVEEWSKHYKVQAEFEATRLRDDRFSSELEVNLYRIMQEALNNIAKHAQAKHVGVVLKRQDGHLILIIEDDGIGFDLEEASSVDANDRGLGLVGMRERAELLGGTLEIESAPGEGTTIFVRVPAQFDTQN